MITRLNFVLICANYYIYKCGQTGTQINLFNFLQECKSRLELTKHYMYQEDKHPLFDGLWAELYDNI
jgi:hypothetical protein